MVVVAMMTTTTIMVVAASRQKENQHTEDVSMNKEDREFIKAEVFNRILRMDALTEPFGISRDCNKLGIFTKDEINFREVVHAAVDKTIDMLCTRITPSLSGGNMAGTHID